LTSLGSSQTLRRPHLSTDAARRFCSLRATIVTDSAAQRHDGWGSRWTACREGGKLLAAAPI
jgi:hypothetical protein